MLLRHFLKRNSRSELCRNKGACNGENKMERFSSYKECYGYEIRIGNHKIGVLACP